MPDVALFGLHIALSLLGACLLANLFVWPWLQGMPRERALSWMIAPHMIIRFIGISFLIVGVVTPAVPSSFAWSTAWGDVVAGMLAIVASIGLARKTGWSIAASWLFNVVGAVDLLLAYVKGMTSNMTPGAFGAAYYIPTAMVPVLLMTHGLTFALLTKRAQGAKAF